MLFLCTLGQLLVKLRKSFFGCCVDPFKLLVRIIFGVGCPLEGEWELGAVKLDVVDGSVSLLRNKVHN